MGVGFYNVLLRCFRLYIQRSFDEGIICSKRRLLMLRKPALTIPPVYTLR